MTTYQPHVLVILFALLVGGHVRAQDHHEEQGVKTGVSQETHIHGIAELLVVLEGEQLDIELHSPAMNLLGFEHQANTPEQQAQINNAKNTLVNAHLLFTFGSAQCQLIAHDVDISHVLDESAHHNTEHHDEEHHDDEPHDGEQDADHHDRHEKDGHSNIEAHYRFRCEQPNTLDSLTTTIPTEFPGIESLQVQWIINGRQGTATLDNIRHHLNFK